MVAWWKRYTRQSCLGCTFECLESHGCGFIDTRRMHPRVRFSPIYRPPSLVPSSPSQESLMQASSCHVRAASASSSRHVASNVSNLLSWPVCSNITCSQSNTRVILLPCQVLHQRAFDQSHQRLQVLPFIDHDEVRASAGNRPRDLTFERACDRACVVRSLKIEGKNLRWREQFKKWLFAWTH